MYTVHVDASRAAEEPEPRNFDKRGAAIKAAKNMSESTWRPVRVSDEKDIERMEYKDGELAYYEYDLRRKYRLERGKKRRK